ncbi:MAG TPA: proprotein convertase P-domain-containing protein [Polyangiaceae bacterium]|jgi:subtilisin-like proprotein convertase family protein|nr:proprotein convertase P-domain-containing protein [Polyangiaceae bacterium]
MRRTPFIASITPSRLHGSASLALCALSALLAAGCAQLLGTSDYREQPSLFEAEDAGGKHKPTHTTHPKDDSATDEPDATPPNTSDVDAATPSKPTPPTQPETMPVATTDGGDEPSTPTTQPTTPGPTETMPPEAGTEGCGSANNECDLVPQCGCQSDENCTVVNLGKGFTGCVAAGDTEPYAPCHGTDGECGAGFACVAGVCKQLCDGTTTNVCGEGAYNACEQVTQAGKPVDGFYVCQRTCDPLEPSHVSDLYAGCGAGANCLPGLDGVSVCVGAKNSGVEGTSCKGPDGPDPQACAPGLACVALATGAVCLPSCNLDGDDCGAGESCVGYSDPVGAADVAIGYCTECQIPAGSDCDPVGQCGCAAGEMCSIVDWETGSTSCVPAGTVEEGGGCTGGATGECAPGTDCMYWVETGVCERFCNSDADCPNVNGGCDIWGDWSAPGAKLCLPGCDPRDPQNDSSPFMACADGQSCVPWWYNENSACVVPQTNGQEGDTCVDEDNCRPGLGCGLDGGHTCGRWCDLGGSDCLSGELCMPHARFQQFALALPAAGVPMGICMPGKVDLTNDTETPISDAAEDGTPAETTSTIEVSGVDGFLSHVAVGLNLSHEYVADLDVYLMSPDGTEIQLFRGSDIGTGLGQGFTSTIFDDTGAMSISDGDEPFSDVYAPFEPLWYLPLSNEDGVDPNGTWTLRIVDSEYADTGSLISWEILLL